METGDFGAAARIRTGDLILTNRPGGVFGRTHSYPRMPSRALYCKGLDSFLLLLGLSRVAEFRVILPGLLENLLENLLPLAQRFLLS